MIASPVPRLCHLARRVVDAVRARIARCTRPAPIAVALGAAADATRSRSDLLLENALLRHQLVVLGRAVKRPRLTATDRGLLVLLASRLRTWAGHSSLSSLRPCCGGIFKGSGCSGSASPARQMAACGSHPRPVNSSGGWRVRIGCGARTGSAGSC